MSINSALQAAASGLTAQSSALSAISNNIANSQTVGYKNNDVAFETLVTGQTGSNITGGGVIATTTQDVSSQGLLQASTSPTDLGISGNGFFVTTQQAAAPTTTTPVLYTRAGSFTTNSQGYLVNSAGLYLQGWPLNAAGVVESDPTNVTKLEPINVNAIAGAATPTTSVQINANINSGTVTSAAAATYNATAAATSMAGGGVTPDVTIPVPLSDSTGGQQTFDLDLLQSGTPNQWYAEVVATPANSVTVAPGVPAGQVAAGIIAFTPTGQYDPANSTGIFASNTPTIALGASNAAAPITAGQVNWGTSLGVAAQTVSFTLGGGSGGVTQFDSPSAVQSIAANGTVFGNLTGVKIGADGSVTAVFDNGVTREVAQVAVATVPNPDGLTAANGDAYTISNTSGSATLKTPGEGGAGSISPSTLEASTVDLSTEFTNLITTQNAYSASAKIITTADQMLQDLLNTIQG
jgi:flagellar hook protein FlgE